MNNLEELSRHLDLVNVSIQKLHIERETIPGEGLKKIIQSQIDGMLSYKMGIEYAIKIIGENSED